MALKRAPGSERGAALFIVVLVVTLLTAIGTFAVHATSLGQLASGYSRRAASAFYLGEFAMNVVASNLADDPRGHVQHATFGSDSCRATADLLPLLQPNAPRFCDVKDSASAKLVVLASNTSLAADPEGFFGALNRPDHPPDQGLDADFRVEITDHGLAPSSVAGMPIGGTAQTWQDAFTVTARVLPTTANGQCSIDATRASENQSLRGYVVYTTPN
jgi:hypothetical protein